MKRSLLFFVPVLMLSQVANAGVVGGGGGPPPVAAEGLDLETGVLKIEQEISEIVEISPDLYSKYVMESALGKPVVFDGVKHTTALMDLANKQIVVKTPDKDTRRILLKRAIDKIEPEKFIQGE